MAERPNSPAPQRSHQSQNEHSKSGCSGKTCKRCASTNTGGGSGSGGGGGGGVIDRRAGLDRRDMGDFAAQRYGREGEVSDDHTGLERRRGPGRRLTDFTKSAEEGEMTPEQFLFVSAVDAFKRANNRMFPTWTDVLEVVRLLGYRKTMPSELSLRNVEDWREKPDTPSGVRSKPGHPEDRRAAA